MSRLVVIWCALVALGGAASAQVEGRQPVGEVYANEGFARGVEAYRRGAYEEADATWRGVLEGDLAEADRARVTYDLGNAAWRRDRVLEAIGWYSASIRLDPRNEDAWANLELARTEAGLDPADRGDLRATIRRLYVAVRPAERRALVLLALLFLALPLAIEAFFGGRLARWLVCLGAIAVLLAVTFWAAGFVVDTERDPVLVIEASAIDLRAEPRQSLAPIARLDPGQQAERIDELPGWVRVETRDGQRGWVRDEAVFPLRP